MAHKLEHDYTVVQLLFRKQQAYTAGALVMNELEQMQLAKIQAEIRKFSAESDKLMLETRWYPMVVTGASFGIIITFTKLFL